MKPFNCFHHDNQTELIRYCYKHFFHIANTVNRSIKSTHTVVIPPASDSSSRSPDNCRGTASRVSALQHSVHLCTPLIELQKVQLIKRLTRAMREQEDPLPEGGHSPFLG